MTRILYGLLFGSGAAGLAYEIVWSRQLGVWLGHGERAAALTLALFFVGMAGGYALAAQTLRSPSRPLRAYAWCELTIAAFALCMPWLHTYRDLHAQLWWVLVPPALAMGASLPFIMHALAARGASLSRAYAIHLLGATLGSFVTTFLLIERLGLWRTTYLAAAISAGCGATAWLMAACEKVSSLHKLEAVAVSSMPAWRWQLAAAWAGAATLALEVLVLRLFALTFHNSTYTFGLTLGVFIVYLALGSRAIAKHETSDPTRAMKRPAQGAALAACGVLCIVPLFSLTTRFGELRAFNFATYILLATGLVACVLALPVIAAGTLLPALWNAARGTVGHTVGTLSAANSLGAAAGALLASFVLLPSLGLLSAFMCIAAAYATLAFMLAGYNRWSVPLTALLLALALLGQGSEPGSPTGFQLLDRWQSPYGWLDLLRAREGQALSARLDLHYQLGSSADRARHMEMGTLPLALYPQAKRALFIGLATGMTASAALSTKSIEEIEVVELVPDMVRVAQHFSAYNGRLLTQQRVHVTIADGRTYLQRTRSRFDVIVADLFVPWHSHAGYLYTLEHYQAAHQRLSEAGVFAQWLPLWQLGSDELELIGQSLGAAFPYTSVWLDDEDDTRALLAIVGHCQAPSLPRHTSKLRHLGAFTTTRHALLNTDEYPRVEFRAPRTERDQKLLRGATLRAYIKRRFGR